MRLICTAMAHDQGTSSPAPSMHKVSPMRSLIVRCSKKLAMLSALRVGLGGGTRPAKPTYPRPSRTMNAGPHQAQIS
jgi:hypothetical protein